MMSAMRLRAWSFGAVAALGLCSAGSAEAKIPVTNRPVNNAPGVFRFAILSDRTGEMRPGIFEDAVTKVNMLQPEFVMSVGDLINGYTKNPKTWDAQWREFEAIVERLQMPFYYVPGNHDITNAKLRAEWKRRRGDPYFSFVYQNVLFLCLDSDEISAGDKGGFGPEQIAWATKTLAAHQDVRWTLLFFHRPLWMAKDMRGFEKIETALQGRNYTVFTAHWHRYLQRERKGMRHYVLATTGGGSKLRGASVGEFDHVTWVTMKPEGPSVVHLELSGIIRDDIVSSANEEQVDTLRSGKWLDVPAFTQDEPLLREAELPIKLTNPHKQPLRVTGKLHGNDGVRFEPAAVDVTVPANGNITVPVRLIANRDPVSIHELNEADFSVTLQATYALKSGDVTIADTRRVQLDWLRTLERSDTAPTIDGDLREWPKDALTTIKAPVITAAATRWDGPGDGHFRFAAREAQGRLFVAVQTVDDRLETRDDEDAPQDTILVEAVIDGKTLSIEAVAGTKTDDRAVRETRTGLVGEFSFPLPATRGPIRLNVGMRDRDRGIKSTVMWWRDPSVPELGRFRRAEP